MSVTFPFASNTNCSKAWTRGLHGDKLYEDRELAESDFVIALCTSGLIIQHLVNPTWGIKRGFALRAAKISSIQWVSLHDGMA